MPQKGYSSVTLPDGLLEEIDRVMKKLNQYDIDLGFISKTDFVRSAIRDYLQKLQTTYLLGVSSEEQ